MVSKMVESTKKKYFKAMVKDGMVRVAMIELIEKSKKDGQCQLVNKSRDFDTGDRVEGS